MKHTSLFDVLIVYNDGMATSASSKIPSIGGPFPLNSNHAQYNDSYEYFLRVCSENYLKAAFTTSHDITGPGRCSSYWIINKGKWRKINKQCYSPLIFDKFSPISDIQKILRETLFSNSLVKSFNKESLFALFFDKQKTHDYLKEFSIPTITINALDPKNIQIAIADLAKLISSHPQKGDFLNKFVLKNKFGSGGNAIYSINAANAEKKISEVAKIDKKISFILQPFVKFDMGFEFAQYSGFVDIRIIYFGNKIIQACIRTAKKNDFRCNVHQGGEILYITQDKIPKNVKNMSEKIINILNEDKALFSLDFIISNRGNVYLLEGNCGPGLNWDLANKMDVRMTKKLIRQIVTELSQRVAINSDTSLAMSFENTNTVN